MKISIVTPTFNYGRFLMKAIESVFSQIDAECFPLSVEHIVMDGGSTDDTLQKLNDWAESVKRLPPDKKDRYRFIWTSEKDKGQTDAINKGLRMASGDVVCWLNADEYYLPGALYKALAAFQKNPDIDFIYGEPLFVDSGGGRIRIKRDHRFSKFVLLWYGCYITSCCSFWRRRLLEDGLYLDDTYKVVMDFEYWVRIMKLGYRFRCLPETIAAFTWHEGNVSTVFREKRREERIKVQMLYGARIFVGNKYQIQVIRLNVFIARAYRRLLVLFRLLFFKRS